MQPFPSPVQEKQEGGGKSVAWENGRRTQCRVSMATARGRGAGGRAGMMEHPLSLATARRREAGRQPDMMEPSLTFITTKQQEPRGMAWHT